MKLHLLSGHCDVSHCQPVLTQSFHGPRSTDQGHGPLVRTGYRHPNMVKYLHYGIQYNDQGET